MAVLSRDKSTEDPEDFNIAVQEAVEKLREVEKEKEAKGVSSQ